MDPREFNLADAMRGDIESCAQAEYRITITLAVRDLAALWSAAAAKALTAPGMRVEDVLDTIGPREAPSVRDCIAMLVAPSTVAGCCVDDFWIDCLPGLPSRAALADLADSERRLGRLPTPLAR